MVQTYQINKSTVRQAYRQNIKPRTQNVKIKILSNWLKAKLHIMPQTLVSDDESILLALLNLILVSMVRDDDGAFHGMINLCIIISRRNCTEEKFYLKTSVIDSYSITINNFLHTILEARKVKQQIGDSGSEIILLFEHLNIHCSSITE